MLDEKEAELQKAEAKIKELESTRPPQTCPTCNKTVDPKKLEFLYHKIGERVTSEQVVRKAQHIVENPHEFAPLFIEPLPQEDIMEIEAPDPPKLPPALGFY